MRRPHWVSNSRNTLVMHRTLPPREYRFGAMARNPAAAIRAGVVHHRHSGPSPSGMLMSASIGPSAVSIVVTSSR
jgi:hypothetical protein